MVLLRPTYLVIILENIFVLSHTRILSHVRMGKSRTSIPIQAAHTRTGNPFAYGLAHTRMGWTW